MPKTTQTYLTLQDQQHTIAARQSPVFEEPWGCVSKKKKEKKKRSPEDGPPQTARNQWRRRAGAQNPQDILRSAQTFDLGRESKKKKTVQSQ